MITLQTLGELNIRRDGQPLPPFKSRKVAALLIYLALNPGPRTRSRLAGLFWSDLPEEKALSNLRFALWNIHEVLGVQVLDADRVSVEWRQNPDVQLDVEEFLRALWQARSQGAETPETVRALEKALELYRGDLLAGFDLPGDVLFNEWLQQQRAHLHRLAVEAFYRLASCYLEHQQLSAAIAVARRLLELEPWHEETHRLLMLALARSGQRSAALAQYAICQRALRDELGVAPSAQTVQLYERIRAAGAGPRHNLPLALTPFVGRREELEELLRLLDDPNCRLLTLVGPGGAGKTRLAQQAAAARADHFLNGVFWVGFEAVDSPARLLPTIAEQLGVEWHQDKLTEQLGRFLREKEMLLVLDNLEGLRAGAGGLAELLRAAPDVKILATSRERLNLQCEWVFPVSGLDFPRGEETDIASFDAVRLFLQTARRADPRTILTPSNTPPIRRICQLVQGMPLALELAAALVSEMSPDEVAQAVEESLRVLVTAAPDVPVRHPWGIALGLDNPGAVACELGDYAAARSYYTGALTPARSIGATRRFLEVLAGLARLAAREGNPAFAVELLTCALNYPELGSEAREPALRLLADLEARLPRDVFAAAVERGRALDWETAVDQVLAGIVPERDVSRETTPRSDTGGRR